MAIPTDQMACIRVYGWDIPNSIEPLDYEEFCLYADAATEIAKREAGGRG